MLIICRWEPAKKVLKNKAEYRIMSAGAWLYRHHLPGIVRLIFIISQIWAEKRRHAMREVSRNAPESNMPGSV